MLRSTLVKLGAAFKPITKLEAEVKKDCKECSHSSDAYKPVPQGDAKIASMLDELLSLGAIADFQADAVIKHASTAPISEEEARGALTRLKTLEAQKPTAGELGRGAIVGAVVSPAASVISRTIAGDKILGDLSGRTPSIQNPKLRTVVNAGRGLASMAAGGAFFGGAMPLVKNELEREAERKKLRAFIGQGVTPNAQMDPQQS